MATCATLEDVDKDLCDQKFYNPLCLTGYLTPLQRKKLREKRNTQSDVVFDSRTPIDVKKVRDIKRQKEHFTKMFSKKSIKRKRSKERIPQIQCKAAKLIFKTANSIGKDKKFFKTSSLNRLEKANFTMPLVFKKNLFLDIGKYVKGTISYSKKLPPHKENSFIMNNPLKPVDCAEIAKSSSVFAPLVIEDNKENSHEKYRGDLQTCVSGVSAFSRVAGSNSVGNEQISNSLKERSVFDFDWPSDELLLKRQEKARAIIRKSNSLKESKVPGKQNNIAEEKQYFDAQPVKLYPIFHIAIKKQSKCSQGINSNPKNGTKRKMDSSRRGEQMIIDAGQKEIGAKICSTCNMIYTVGQDDDEKLHLNYHDMYLINLRFPGWKEENVIGEYRDGRIIMVRQDDKSVKLKKIEDILMIANRDLGFPSSAVPTKPDLTFILFISSTKQVAGCVVAEPISSACQVLLADSELAVNVSDQKEMVWRIGNWYSSSETVPAICGINRIWVDHRFRHHKVASRMIDCLRCNFIHGHVIGIRELAFTDPSPDGQAFAAAYTGTNNFLVYR